MERIKMNGTFKLLTMECALVFLGLTVLKAQEGLNSGVTGANDINATTRQMQALKSLQSQAALNFEPLINNLIPASAVPEVGVPASVVPAHRWVLGLQPVLGADMYRNQIAFEERLSGMISKALADKRIARTDQKLVVLPEYFGTWLAVADEDKIVYSARTKTEAIKALIFHNVKFDLYLAREAWRQKRNPIDPDFVFSTLLHFKAKKIWEIFSVSCSRLAIRYGVTLVPGSIVLPPLNALEDPDAPLYNTAFIFGPDGALLHTTRKVYPTRSELGFTARGALKDVTVARIPFGRVGVLICADGWAYKVYDRLRDAELLLQPSFGYGGLAAYEEPWRGYNGQINPPEVEPSDIGHITERQAWLKYSLAGKIHATSAILGVNVFMAGQLWDIVTSGYGIVADRASGKIAQTCTNDRRDTFIRVQLP